LDKKLTFDVPTYLPVKCQGGGGDGGGEGGGGGDGGDVFNSFSCFL
jgi:hypothetical protein